MNSIYIKYNYPTVILFSFIIVFSIISPPAFAETDTTNVDQLNLEAYNRLHINPKESLENSTQALIKSKNIGYPRGEVDARNNLGVINYFLGKDHEAHEHFKEAIRISKQIDNYRLKDIYLNLGNVYQNKHQYDTALSYYNRTLDIIDSNDIKTHSVIWMNQGIIHARKEEISEALDHLLKALDRFEVIDENEFAADCMLNLATLYSQTNNPGLGKFYYEKALKKYRLLEKKRKIANCLLPLAGLTSTSDIDKSINLFKESISIFTEIQDQRALSISLTNLGSVYQNLGKYQKAMSCLKKSIELKKKINDTEGLGIAQNILAENYLLIGKNKLALNTIRESIKNINTTKTLSNYINALKISSRIYYANHMPDSAYGQLQTVIQLSDSLFRLENMQSMKQAIAKYEVNKKDNYIDLQKQEIRLLEKEKSLNRILISSILLVSIIVSISIFFSYRKQKKEKDKSIILLKENKLLSAKNRNLIQQKMDLLNKEKDILQAQLANKHEQVTRFALQISWKNEFISAIKEKMRVVKKEKDNQMIVRSISELVAQITNSLALEKERHDFNNMVEELHADFFTKLSDKYPLTNDEKKLAAYLRLNLSSKEMAVLFNISSKSVDMKRYRLRKKLNIPADIRLSDFFQSV